MKNFSSASFSSQVSGKNSESKINPARKKFLKNLSFGVDVKLQVPPLTYKINAHVCIYVCWLIRRLSQGSSPRPNIKTKYKKYFFSAISFQQISGKNSVKVNKIAMKSFSKNISLGVDYKLQVPPLMYKINKHNVSGVRNQVNNPD